MLTQYQVACVVMNVHIIYKIQRNIVQKNAQMINNMKYKQQENIVYLTVVQLIIIINKVQVVLFHVLEVMLNQ